VTVAPRFFLPLPRHRRESERILAKLSERHPPTPHDHGDWLHLDFPKRKDRFAARAEVIALLDQINPDWEKYVKVSSRA
jgi:hypothetical protein